MNSKLSIAVHRGPAGLRELSSEWAALERRVAPVACHHSFLFYEAMLRFRHRSPKEVFFFAARDRQDVLLAVCPLELARRTICRLPFTVWQPPHDLEHPAHDFPAAPEVEPEMLFSALQPVLRQIGPTAALLAADRCETGGMLAAILNSNGRRAAVKPFGENLRLPTIGDVDAIIAGTRKKFRSNLRRGWRDLRAAGRVDYGLSTDVDSVKRDFEVFVELEGAGWKGQTRHGLAIALNRQKREMYRRQLTYFADQEAGEVHTLWVNEECVAAMLAVKAKGEIFLLKLSYQEAWGSASPGHLLIQKALATWCADAGVAHCNIGWEAKWFSSWHPERTPIWTGYINLGSSSGGLAHRLLRLRGWRPPGGF